MKYQKQQDNTDDHNRPDDSKDDPVVVMDCISEKYDPVSYRNNQKEDPYMFIQDLDRFSFSF